MKILNAGQIRQWDATTMAEQNISQTELMKRAGNLCAHWLKKKFGNSFSFYIFCGKGGNGGDGLVIARDLLHAGRQVSILLAASPEAFKGATLDHWHILQKEFPEIAGSAILITDRQDSPDFTLGGSPIIIDALLGTGYQYKPGKKNSPLTKTIQNINAADAPVIAIDLPSGLSTDSLPTPLKGKENQDEGDRGEGEVITDTAAIIQATYTLSFQAYKRSFLHPESAGYTGKIHILDIGLSDSFLQNENATVFATNLMAAALIYHPRTSQTFGHKGSFGTAVLVGGSYGKIGAIALSAKAALRAGVGKVFIQAPKCGYEILQTSIPEAMFEPAGDSYVADINLHPKVTFGIGPGMDTHPESIGALKTFLEAQQSPLVLDADALNIMATAGEDFFPLIPTNSILTPHPGEFQRLFGQSDNSLQQVQLASKAAKKWQIIIVLKGHRTAICTPNGPIHYNLSGNAGMATAGSGDVLTGIITSLLAQSYAPTKAAILGVYLHGLAGDIYAKKNSQESLIAHDLIEYLPEAFRKIAKFQKKAMDRKWRSF